MIEINHLTKNYSGMEIPAINDLSLRVERNAIFGLLGPNGAGKTTLINILIGAVKPDNGKVIIGGHDISVDAGKIKSIMGIVPQDIALYPTLTVKENLLIFGSMYNMPAKVLKERISECLSLYGLEKKGKVIVKKLSGGMKRRLNIIAGILHKPELLVLDEPTAGIDVQSKMVILENLRDMNKQGVTILYTSHYMDEAEKFCSYTTIIDSGNVIAQGKPIDLINQTEDCNFLEDVFIKLTGRKIRE